MTKPLPPGAAHDAEYNPDTRGGVDSDGSAYASKGKQSGLFWINIARHAAESAAALLVPEAKRLHKKLGDAIRYAEAQIEEHKP